MKEWSEAILEAINSLGNEATLSDIYGALEDHFSLSEQNLGETRYEGRPAFQHEVRSFVTNLRESGELERTGRGKYRLTHKGINRLARWMASDGRSLHEPKASYIASPPAAYLLNIQIEPLDEGGYLAVCEDLQGCHAEGDSVAQALENIEDVARALLELRDEDGLPLPEGLVTYRRDKAISAQLVVATKG